uniref:Uncharacterized protein n=1 Tax=Arundo donax TaxID=35708 RepID=A0A0A8YNH4_ARUDO
MTTSHRTPPRCMCMDRPLGWTSRSGTCRCAR